MLSTRVIPCLLLQDGGLVKTVKFKDAKYVGDPINAIRIFNEKEVDELIFIDIEASKKAYGPRLDVIRDLATEAFMPFAYGGGITKLNQVQEILRVGVEKVILNNVALTNPSFVKEAAIHFGNSTIIGAVDIDKDWLGRSKVYNHALKKLTAIEARDHIRMLEDAGVGEIFINCVYRDGTYAGFDVPLVSDLSSQVNVPLIVCGGASSVQDIKNVVTHAKVSAVAAGSLFVFQGPHRAVLISYPSQAELKNLFS